ncbi:mechanosensitive ion channel family protein [Corynebacterium sp. H128]|uniref:mechanosensitive ion channel family protein n=1 Tax=unclassified Corynebacterium TaxID=2624378 RepID=UPI0030A6408E
MPIEYILEATKNWIITHGLFLGMLVVIGFLIPRVGRRIILGGSQAVDEGTEAAKGRKALIGAMVYIAEAVAYTVLAIAAMKNLGVNLAAAAIPATVVSAAVGFGSQKIIGDLLGGFFIITEKQYGVGDWVKFYGSAATVEGDVVDMTLRATTIRTMNGEEITVPNGEARMCVNSSARWARAVIAIPVPITAGSSISEINARTLAATEDAIAEPEIAEHIRSEVTFQAATAVTPPTAMGLPWTATMRLLIDVAPGKQWLVERAVRAAVLDEWWEDYGERASNTPLVDDQLGESLRHLLDTEEFRPIPAAAVSPGGSAPATVNESEALANAAENVDVPREQVMREIVEREDERTGVDQHDNGLLSLGGRVRPSTTILLLSLLGFMLLGAMTLSGGEGHQDGWLAPQQPTTQSEVPVESAPAQPTSYTPETEEPTSVREAPVSSAPASSAPRQEEESEDESTTSSTAPAWTPAPPPAVTEEPAPPAVSEMPESTPAP